MKKMKKNKTDIMHTYTFDEPHKYVIINDDTMMYYLQIQ